MIRSLAAMAARTSWRTGWVVFVVVVLLLLLSFHVFSQGRLEHEAWYTLPAPCSMPPTVLADMVQLARLMHDALDAMNVSHALCFGTLWGALRSGRILPWDNNVDMCALTSQFRLSSGQTRQEFEQRKMEVSYDWRAGAYRVSYHSAVGNVHTYTKSFDGEDAWPGGVANGFWRWWGGGDQLSFPARLLDVPLNTAKLHGQDMPVPHEGIEMLKYLYPQNWWLVVKPPGC